MMKMKSTNGAHQKIVFDLETRLHMSGRYSYILPNEEYQEGELVGEVDILAFTRYGNFVHFYEVKSVDSDKAWEKSNEQYNRYKKAFPNLKIKGVYVTPQRTTRLR